MSLSYNQDTAVYRQDPAFYDQIATSENTIQDISGSNIDKVTNKFSYVFTATGTYTLPYDIILTEIILTGACDTDSGNSGSFSADAVINGSTIHRIIAGFPLNATISQTQKITIPNWKIERGSVLSSTIVTTRSSATITFIGYLT